MVNPALLKEAISSNEVDEALQSSMSGKEEKLLVDCAAFVVVEKSTRRSDSL
jgi:hypothetical protein